MGRPHASDAAPAPWRRVVGKRPFRGGRTRAASHGRDDGGTSDRTVAAWGAARAVVIVRGGDDGAVAQPLIEALSSPPPDGGADGDRLFPGRGLGSCHGGISTAATRNAVAPHSEACLSVLPFVAEITASSEVHRNICRGWMTHPRPTRSWPIPQRIDFCICVPPPTHPTPLRLQNGASSGTALFLERRHFEL